VATLSGMVLHSSVPLLTANPPASSSSSSNEKKQISPVCEWSVENGVEHYHDQLIGSRSLLYEGCEWICLMIGMSGDS